MKKITKNLIHQFELHVSGATGRPYADGLYRRAAVHRCADLWLSDMGVINASVRNDDDARACIKVYKNALAKQMENSDFYAAELLVIRAFPLTKRFNDTFTIISDLIDIALYAWKKGKDPYCKQYVNFYELRESVERFAHRCGNIIDEIIIGKCIDKPEPSHFQTDIGQDILFIILISILGDFCSEESSA